MVDVSNQDASKSVMLALLPINSDWSRIDLPHLTLVYAGLIQDLPATARNELAKDAASIAMFSRTLTLRVLGVQVFGDVEKVDALKFQTTPELQTMRRSVEHWNASEFPFNPHATIGPTGPPLSNIPSWVAFNRIVLGWGSEQMVFWFRDS